MSNTKLCAHIVKAVTVGLVWLRVMGDEELHKIAHLQVSVQVCLVDEDFLDDSKNSSISSKTRTDTDGPCVFCHHRWRSDLSER